MRRDIRPDRLAQAIVKSVPDDVRDQCQGRCSPELDRWLAQLMEQVARGVLPSAFDDNPNDDYFQWQLLATWGALGETLPSPPGYVVPGKEPQWYEKPLWRGAIEQARLLDAEDEFLLSFRHAEDFGKVAHDLAVVLREVDISMASMALKAAIAKLT